MKIRFQLGIQQIQLKLTANSQDDVTILAHLMFSSPAASRADLIEKHR